MYADLTARTATAFRPLTEVAAWTGVVRPGIELDDLLLAILMAEVSAEAEPAARTQHHTRSRSRSRSRRILRNGLFTDAAVAAFEAGA